MLGRDAQVAAFTEFVEVSRRRRVETRTTTASIVTIGGHFLLDSQGHFVHTGGVSEVKVQ